MGKHDENSAIREKELPPLLDEFRTALQDEIEVAKRNAHSGAIPLSNGHRIGKQGSAFQYTFQIDSVLNTPDGAPGDLVVPGKMPMGVTIVSTEGLRLVISVETDLGKFVPNARLQTNLVILMRKLIERIEINSSAGNPAATRMLGTSPVSGIPITPKVTPKLYESQMQALESVLGRNLTLIWGPPGTGKTHTIGTIAEHLFTSARTVLLVSHTNTAVDQAIKHVAKSMSEKHLEQGILIRIGEVRDNVLKTDFPDVLLKTQIERQSKELVELRNNFVNQKQQLSDNLSQVNKEISFIEWIREANDKIKSTAELLENLKKQEEELISFKNSLKVLEDKHTQLLELHKRTSKIHTLRKKQDFLLGEKSRLEGLLSKKIKDCEIANNRIQIQEDRIKIAQRISPLRKERATYPSPTRQKTIIENLSLELEKIKERILNIQHSYSEAKAILEQTSNFGAIKRFLKGLPNPESQKIVV